MNKKTLSFMVPAILATSLIAFTTAYAHGDHHHKQTEPVTLLVNFQIASSGVSADSHKDHISEGCISGESRNEIQRTGNGRKHENARHDPEPVSMDDKGKHDQCETNEQEGDNGVFFLILKHMIHTTWFP